MRQEILTKIQAQIAEKLYPGASLALFSNGQWQEYYLGQAEEHMEIKPGLVYDLASVSKVVGVGTVLIWLIQEGKIALDEPFSIYYPAFHDQTVTIRQLVTHTSGIDPFIPNRDRLDAAGLKAAMHELTVTADKSFKYTDVNLILLGFMVESLFGKDLDQILQEKIFEPWEMTETCFGPRQQAVATVKGQRAGLVHDPKAKVLGVHCGSAGLFSTLSDLELFLEHYLQDDFAENLTINISSSKPRSIVWNIDEEDWLDHTGYTGPFIMVNRKAQKAAIFLTNRTYHYDNRPLWIEKRRELRDVIKENL
ncbi:D-alanyl-D-alanine-carboxypeptidase/endopeptidaseAmpH precursor [Chlamydia trachomatis]|nr:D-alanyl-D-alanine-carboxypeptidase/endopeptidaseAmpH precursor [Chlamydia trachomatis]CRH88902.1 D-alanyl-D-alanine-carboxypeptidase/endopeptidaseAmpH precursor [Chlamydia trachomatis]